MVIPSTLRLYSLIARPCATPYNESMTLFYLIRHAETVWGPGDSPLSAHGQRQAAAAGVYLHDKAIQRIYASPLLRARQTAEIIAQVVGAGDDFGQSAPLAVETDARL